MSDQEHSCFTCEKSFLTRVELVSHLSLHSESRLISCTLCSQDFVLEGNLIEHLLTHHCENSGEQFRQEPICSFKKFLDNFKSIEKQKHTSGVFRDADFHKNMSKPLKEYHYQNSQNQRLSRDPAITIENSFSAGIRKSVMHECIVCEKKFMLHSKLAQHLKKHMNSCDNVCNICNKTFSDQYVLKDHMVLHSGAKPYECEFCDKAFAWKPCLIVHRRKHTGEKPYVCEKCEWAFPTNTHLKRHVAEKHSKIKPFKCDVCCKAFSVKGRLQEHMKNHGESPTLQKLIKLGYSFPILNE